MTDGSVQQFYDELAASYHLIFADWKGSSMPRQGEALDRMIRAEVGPPPLSVLDCSCGIGTQSIGLALRGYNVRGTDLSPKAVERARREAVEAGVEIDFGVADLRTLGAQVPGTFDVVLSCDNSLPHLLGDEDLLAAARNMRAKLRPGGLVVVGIRDYDRLTVERPRATPVQVFRDDGEMRVVFQVWDWAEDGKTYLVHLFVVTEHAGGWETQHHVTHYRALLRGELDEILRGAGFSVLRWHMPDETGHHQPLVTARRV